MDVMHIVPTRDTPEVVLDKRTGKLRIEGNSYPSNSPEFYAPILEWYSARLNDQTLASIDIELYFHYINTSSTKIVIKFLEMLESFHSAGRPVHVRWFYDPDDANMHGIGEDIRNFVSLPFDLVVVQD